MALSSEAQALITKLEAVHERAASGDMEAMHLIKSLKTRALSGEVQARRIYNTLAVIHWRKQKGGDYDKAEAYYNRLRAKEPVAMAKLQTLIQRVRAGDPDAKTLLSVLKSIHNKNKSSAFTDGPGAPKIGGYGLPEQHRPGIIIGGTEPLSYGHGGGYPMSHPHDLRRHPFLSHPQRTRFSGVGDVQQLTPAALSGLLSLMMQVRAMPIAAAILNLNQFQTASAQLPGSAPGSLSTVPDSSVFSTVPAPSGGAVKSVMSRAVLSTAPKPVVASLVVASLGRIMSAALTPAQIAASAATEARLAAQGTNQPLCNSARSAADRGSPAAGSLMTQCRAVRRNNVLAGKFFTDAMGSNDAAYRAALLDAGNAVVNSQPSLVAFRNTVPFARRQGFSIAMGIRAGQMDPGYPAFVRPGLAVDADLLAGYDLGMSMA